MPAAEPVTTATGTASPSGVAAAWAPPPFDDVDALEALEHEILTLEAHLQAAKHRFLALLAEFDRREGWRLAEHRSCAHWLHHRSGMSLRTAREQVRVARALESLPRIAAAMSRGELHYCQVRALVRVATPECETELLEVAKSATTAELERFVRGWRWIAGADEERLERERHGLRRLVVFPDEGGMYVVRGRVTAEVGARLMRTIEAASDALFCEEAAAETTPEQRRADALALVAERAMAAGFGGRRGAPTGADGPGPDPEGGRDGEAEGAGDGISTERSRPGSGSAPRPGSPPASRPTERGSYEPCGCGGPGRAVLSGARAERYQVFVHVDPGTLGAADERNGLPDGLPPGPHGIAPAPRSHLEDGTRLPAGTARRLCCDAALVRVVWGGEGELLDLGRKRRTIPPAVRRALELRDGGCRWPGCGLRFTDAHHVVHWADGGETSLDNLILLCPHDHRAVHEGGWRVEWWGRERHLAFIDPRGRVRTETEPRPRPALPDEPAAALAAEQRARGIEPDRWSLARRWRPGPELPWALEAAALEALEEAHFGG